MIEIRAETPEDTARVRDVNRRAFGQDDEGRIVDALRANGAVLCSLVATDAGDVVGHITYSPARVGGVMGAALGPMAVTPERQRQGIGTRLVATGNDQLAGHRRAFIVVVGHPTFYSRFGFEPASAHRLTCEWDVPDDVFMVRVLDPHTMAAAVGRVHYRPEFALAE